MSNCPTTRRDTNGLHEFCKLPEGHWANPNLPEACMFDIAEVRRFWTRHALPTDRR